MDLVEKGRPNKMKNNQEELRECPFCGEAGTLTNNPPECGCDKCAFWFDGEYAEEAVRLWNTRHEVKGGLVELNRDRLFSFILCKIGKDPVVDIPNSIYLSDAICQRFGTPAVLTVEEIEKICFNMADKVNTGGTIFIPGNHFNTLAKAIRKSLIERK